MTDLYLKKEGGGWTKVCFDASNGFKLTRENPYFTQSESYTFDVSIPMEILDNRRFFQNLQRMESSKKAALLKCRLIVNNQCMVDGIAKITQVTESLVKVQLIGGNSEIKLLSSENSTYIDEMELGYVYYTGGSDYFGGVDYEGNKGNLENKGIITFMPVYDETNSRALNRQFFSTYTQTWSMIKNAALSENALHPNLLYIIKAVVGLSGYNLARCDFDREPWNALFVASAKSTSKLSHALPHWLVSDFINEVCKFFNCTLVVDSFKKEVSFVGNDEFYGAAEQIVLTPIDEYTAELTEDGNDSALASSNIEYDLSSSDEHTTDCLSEEVRQSIPSRECADRSAAKELFASLDETERLRYVYKCLEGSFVGWTGATLAPVLIKVDHFAPLIRDPESDSSISLKICPVALMKTDEAFLIGKSTTEANGATGVAACLENPTGSDGDCNPDDITAQELIEGDESVDTVEKEDRLQVMFVDDTAQYVDLAKGNHNLQECYKVTMPFTDCDFLRDDLSPHRPWSLSLNKTDAGYYIGQLHQTEFSFDTKAKMTVKFVAEKMPDPTAVYLIRGKRYGCEKIEANVTEQGFDRLMTGYFYEMTS